MSDLNSMPKILIVIGVIFIGIGLVLVIFSKLPWMGKLPGDISIKKDSFTFYFPIATCLIISLVMTLVLNLFRK